MKIVTLVKQTFDTEAKLIVNGGKIDETGVNLIMNPYDEFAVEEGIRIFEKQGGEVIALSVSANPKAQDALRQALAMGAERAVLINDPALVGADEHATAAVLAKALGTIGYDLILAGRISVDNQASHVVARVAENLGLPIVTSVIKLELSGNTALCTREIDGGTEVVEVSLPAVVTAQKGLNDPRYPSLPNIMKAKRKELKVLTLADIGMDPALAGSAGSLLEVLEITLPPARLAGKLLSGDASEVAKQLVNLLQNEAKVI